MSPKLDPSLYEVYVIHRGRKAASPTGQLLGRETVPNTWQHGGKTYYWVGLDSILKIVVFSETDPRTAISL